MLKGVQTEKVKDTIYELFQKVLRSNNSYGPDFLADFYKKVMKYDKNVQPGLFDSLLAWMAATLTSQHIKYEKVGQYLNISHTKFLQVGNASILMEPIGTPIDTGTKEVLLKLYLQAINELPKDVKKILMYSEKFVSESRLLESSPPKEWYKLWLENINDHNRNNLT